MALTDFQEHFDNTYEDIFQKVLVAKAIMNTRFQSGLRYGESLERFAYDISAVRVRTVVRGSASTIDAVTDSTELLTVNIEKESVFFLSDGEMTQAGPLNPGTVIGGKVAVKVAEDLDARCFAEVLNAYQTFDNGDLTTLVSTGTPITLSSTTVPQMVTRMPAKLRRGANQTINNMAFVVDSYAAADIEQYLLGKQFSIVESVFKNGYAGPIATAEVYVSENLTGSAVLTISEDVTANDTVTINGVVFTFVAALSAGPAVEGEVVAGANADASRLNLTNAINTPGTTTATYTAVSAANQVLLTDTYKISAVNDATANTMTITGIGAGRLTVSETLTHASNVWSLNTLHAYYGKKGAIDLVVQDKASVDVRQTSDRRGSNIFSSYLAGLKTFADGAKQFLDVKIAA